MEKCEKVIPAMRIHAKNYEFIKDFSEKNSNSNISGEIRKMLLYVDMTRDKYIELMPQILELSKTNKKDIDKSKNQEKLKKQLIKIKKKLSEYEDESNNLSYSDRI